MNSKKIIGYSLLIMITLVSSISMNFNNSSSIHDLYGDHFPTSASVEIMIINEEVPQYHWDQYGFSGNGSSDNPYIIEYLHLQFGNNILLSLENINSHFIIQHSIFNFVFSENQDSYIHGVSVNNGYIYNCSFLDPSLYGINLGITSNLTIHECHFYNNPYAIQISGKTVCIKNNIFEEGVYAIKIYGDSYQITLEANQIINVNNGFALTQGLHHSIIQQNNFTGNQKPLILDIAYDNHIQSNRFTSTNYGVYCTDTLRINITDNYFQEVSTVYYFSQFSYNNNANGNNYVNCTTIGLDEGKNNELEGYIKEPLMKIETNQNPMEINGDNISNLSVVSGTGNKTDPYVIKDLQISGNFADYCMRIHQIENAYLIIENCTFAFSLFSNDQYDAGLDLYLINNVKVRNCTFINNNIGIFLSATSNVSVTDCIFIDHRTYGIRILSSGNFSIFNNTYINNVDAGIQINTPENEGNNSIHHNHFFEGGPAFDVSGNGGNLNISYNQINGTSLLYANFASHYNFTNNKLNNSNLFINMKNATAFWFAYNYLNNSGKYWENYRNSAQNNYFINNTFENIESLYYLQEYENNNNYFSGNTYIQSAWGMLNNSEPIIGDKISIKLNSYLDKFSANYTLYVENDLIGENISEIEFLTQKLGLTTFLVEKTGEKQEIWRGLYTIQTSMVQANFTANSTEIKEGEWIKIIDSSIHSSTSIYHWEISDGTQYFGIDGFQHQFNFEGFYVITLNLSAQGYSDEISIEIHVLNNQPLANIRISGNLVEDNELSFFPEIEEGNPPFLYQWDFGDGTDNSTEENPVHIYSDTGNYTITLSIIDVDGDVYIITLNITIIEKNTNSETSISNTSTPENDIPGFLYFIPILIGHIFIITLIQKRKCLR